MNKPLPQLVAISSPDAPDPLLAALIGKLPTSGTSWPGDKRAAWLKMMWMAFDVVYEGEAIEMPAFLFNPGPQVPSVTAASTGQAAKQANTPSFPFYIDRDGFARRAGGAPVNPQDVIGTIFDHRGEAGDLRAIIWADGRTGVAGLQLDIAAA